MLRRLSFVSVSPRLDIRAATRGRPSSSTSNRKQTVMGVQREVAKVFVASPQSEGVGACVRRSIGSHSMPNLDPFLLLDEFHVRKPAGFPEYA